MLVLSLVLLCASGSFSAPARVLKQRVQKFKNFPVVGIKEIPSETAETEPASFTQAKPLAIVDHPRDARQADAESYNDNNEDLFIEEAVYLTPEAREARAAALDGLSEEPAAVGDVFGDDIFFNDETEQDDEEYAREERDGAHGHHRGSHRGSSSRRGGRVAPAPAPVVNEYDNYDYDYQEEEAPQRSQPQQQRRGKQTGATGVALGVLSSPSDQDGNYNFK